MLHKQKREKLQATDEAAEQYYTEILAYCRYHLNFDRPTAEECTQDVFAAFFEYSADSEIRFPRAWLYRTADNYINRYRRCMEKQKATILTFPEEENHAIWGNPALTYNQDFDRIFDRSINIEKYAERVVACLSRDELKLYRLYYQDHLSLNEIAEIYALTYKAASNRLYRIKIKLKKEIAKLKFEMDSFRNYR
ncbi:MAG: sigma-70 family RNA polymerase sigma factor [Clostridiales bacterium]|nr:sigma-70 family RNA polymerase sigma factor [Clostridiales bacterium]